MIIACNHLLHYLPVHISQSLYFRFYNTKEAHLKFPPLFKTIKPRFSPYLMYNLIPGDLISGSIAITGIYEPELTKEIFRLAERGGLLVDVGANMGYFSLIWAGANKNNKVHAFEASPQIATICDTNIRNNALSVQIHLHRVAVSRENGEIEFNTVSDTQTGWGGVVLTPTEISIKVPTVTIDKVLPDQLIDVLKIDIEGADTWALEGCENLLRSKKIKKIFFEQNVIRMKELGIKESSAIGFLQSFGYICEPFLTNGTNVIEWVAFPK